MSVIEKQKERILYLENTIKALVDLLCEKKILDQDFRFLTEEERAKRLALFIDEFIEG